VAVHVSIHDVSPLWVDEIEAALELCASADIRPALLVVPNFHARSPLVDDARFCERLRQLQARGHEIFLHGFLHQSRGRPHGILGIEHFGWFFAQRIASSDEAEMSELSPAQARERLDEGERILSAAGLRVEGFVPPAWCMPRWLPSLLAARGYRFTEDHLRVYDPLAARARASVVLNWASRSPTRLVSTVAWCRVARHARAVAPARIAIHPGDMRVLLLRRELARTLAWARGDVVERGGDLLA
jgi:predicted deacetylase